MMTTGNLSDTVLDSVYRFSTVYARDSSGNIFTDLDARQITDEELAIFLKTHPTLVYLDLSFNQKITDDGLAALEDASMLTVLQLSHCRNITDAGLVHLRSLTELEKLNLAGCSVTDDALESLVDMKKLRALELVGCMNISGAGFRFLENLPLEIVSLPPRVKTDEGIHVLKYLHSLRILTLWNSSFAGPLLHLPSLSPTLVKLDLSGCSNITGIILEDQNPDFDKLQVVRLNGCRSFSDSGLAVFSKAVNVKRFEMRGCQAVTSDGLKNLTILKQLHTLNIENCGIRSNAFESLSQMVSLRVLMMLGTRIPDEECKRLKAVLPELQITRQSLWSRIFQFISLAFLLPIGCLALLGLVISLIYQVVLDLSVSVHENGIKKSLIFGTMMIAAAFLMFRFIHLLISKRSRKSQKRKR